MHDQVQLSESEAAPALARQDSRLNFLAQAQEDAQIALQNQMPRSACRLCGREVPVARLVEHSKVCKISSRYQTVITKCDKDLGMLEQSLTKGESCKQLGTLCAVARSIQPTEPGALHRCKRLRQRLGAVQAKSGTVEELEPILRAVEEKMRSIKGMDNLAWRQPRAGLGIDGKDESESSPAAHRADVLERSQYTKWIYQTLCRSSFFQKGVPESERRHFSTTRRIQCLKQRYRLVRESMVDVIDLSRDNASWPRAQIDQRNFNASWADTSERYQIAGELGRGSVGLIYRVVRLQDKKQFALKLFKPGTEIRRAIKEAHAMNTCEGHPNVLRLESAMLGDPSQPALLMELADSDLFDHVLASGGLEQDYAQQIFRSLLLGLQHMHQMHLAHRDLKLENLLLCGGVLKIADFDLCSIDYCQGTAPWFAYRPCGTVAYASPELFGLRQGLIARISWVQVKAMTLECQMYGLLESACMQW